MDRFHTQGRDQYQNWCKEKRRLPIVRIFEKKKTTYNHSWQSIFFFLIALENSTFALNEYALCRMY